MKIRNGFVSNSSSSSFVVIGKSVNVEDLMPKDLEKKNYFIDTGYSYEGPVHIITKWFDKNEYAELLEAIKDKGDEEKKEFEIGEVLEIVKYGSDSGEFSLNKNDLPNGDLMIIYGDCDQHSPTSMSDIDEMLQYGDY